jgi:hypothetical protein
MLRFHTFRIITAVSPFGVGTRKSLMKPACGYLAMKVLCCAVLCCAVLCCAVQLSS